MCAARTIADDDVNSVADNVANNVTVANSVAITNSVLPPSLPTFNYRIPSHWRSCPIPRL